MAMAAPCPTSVSSANVAFGTYNSSVVNNTGTVSFTCPPSQTYTIGLDAGTSSGGTVTSRSMTGPGSALLGYSLYTDSGRTSNWGNTSPTWKSGTTITGNDPITVYGQIPANEYPTPGSYTDTITATIADTTSGNTPGTTTKTFTVTATVSAACEISATALAFGTYSGAVNNSTSTISVTCTNTTTYNVGLNAGTTTGSTVTARKMAGPSSATLNYAMYSNSGRTTNWGNTVGTDTVAGTGDGTAQNLTVYGQIPAGQSVALGSFTDTIIATITY
jgi:spore coat protein U-like protein